MATFFLGPQVVFALCPHVSVTNLLFNDTSFIGLRSTSVISFYLGVRTQHVDFGETQAGPHRCPKDVCVPEKGISQVTLQRTEAGDTLMEWQVQGPFLSRKGNQVPLRSTFGCLLGETCHVPRVPWRRDTDNGSNYKPQIKLC